VKPTRTCHWPPRLDQTVRASIRTPGADVRRTTRLHPAAGRTAVAARPPVGAHPVMRALARARQDGRIAHPRRYEPASTPRPVPIASPR
jgi:hypothetical protein